MADATRSRVRSVRRRPFGVRLYLALAFASVALITGIAVGADVWQRHAPVLRAS